MDFTDNVRHRDRAFACIDVMRAMAEARGISVARIAIAWLLHRIKLSDEELAQLDLVSALPHEYPGWMIQRQTAGQQRSEVGGAPHDSSAGLIASKRLDVMPRHDQPTMVDQTAVVFGARP